MTELNEADVKLPDGYRVASTIVIPRPDERAFGLRKAEFQILCDENPSNYQTGKSTCIGIFWGALASIVSMYVAIDWSSFWAQRNWKVGVCFLIPILIAVGSAVGLFFYRSQSNREDNPHSRLTNSIEEFFRQNENSSAEKNT
jgi:hypothetical protein